MFRFYLFAFVLLVSWAPVVEAFARAEP